MDERRGDCVVELAASENKTARPQAAGTGRYHLPFNAADETVGVCRGVGTVMGKAVRTSEQISGSEGR